MKMLKPLHDRVVVRRIEEDVNNFGIHLPDNAREEPMTGEVISVGTGKLLESGSRIPIAVTPGDVVLFAKYGGLDVQLGPSDKYLVLREDEIMCKVVEVQDIEEVENIAAQ